jgi:hypothetical protein
MESNHVSGNDKTEILLKVALLHRLIVLFLKRVSKLLKFQIFFLIICTHTKTTNVMHLFQLTPLIVNFD